LWRVRATIVAVEKQTESVFAARAVLPVACPALQRFFFPTLSRKRHNLKKKSYCAQNVCFDFLYKFCLKRISF
jgi:hypothetical protein